MNGFGTILKRYLEYNKITQTNFASRLGISTKHMNEIINGNTNVSPELMIAISLLTDIDIKVIMLSEQRKEMHNYLYNRFKTEKEIKKFLDSFYINEMDKKNWLILRNKDSLEQNAIDLLKFMKIRNFDIYEKYFNSKIMYKKKDDANQKKIFLWINRCDNLTNGVEVPPYLSSKLDELFTEIKIESNKSFNKDKLIQILNKYGIILCINDALDGTKVRGCSFVKGKTPVIYLTTYFKEKSSLYFTLYHELYHIKKDYNKLINKIYIDNEDDEEKEADLFALNKMIDINIWNEIINNLSNVDSLCKKYDIPKCFVYTRLAYEKIIKYNSKEYNDNIEKIQLY